MDAPIAIDQGNNLGIWRPQNYGREFFGPSTLRLGIEKSRNVMTVRLAQEMGMDVISEYGERFGIYDDLPPVLAMALGAGETTLLRITAAYGMLANGGRRITPTLIDRVQDRYGRTVTRHDGRQCPDCEAVRWTGQPEPVLPDDRDLVLDPLTAYQMTSMLEGVVQRGTAGALKSIGKPLAGKTGTTNEERDAWFIGYTPDLVVGVFIGYDQPRPMGHGATGGGLAVPIFATFMAEALKTEPAIPFRVPPGINLVRINAKTGVLALPGEEDVIVEAFKPGHLPPDNPMDVIGGETVDLALPAAVGGPVTGALGPLPATSDAGGGNLTSGSGGLY
jgi:penicillin-binding protein 1A